MWYNTRMKAWKITAPRELALEEVKSESVGEECVKIKILNYGVSTADAALYNGTVSATYPIIPCRQCVGFVSEVGERVKSLQRGNRVVAYPYVQCGTCSACEDSRPLDCENLATIGMDEDGFARDFAVLGANALYALPDRVSDEEAIYTEHIAMAINTLNSLDLQKGEHIVIIGATIMGIIMAQVATYYQAVPIIVDLRSDRLDIARSLGVTYAINAVDDDPSKKIFSITGGHMAEAVAFMLSSDMPLQRCIDYCARSARLALVGWKNNKTDLNINLKQLIAKRGRLITITDCGRNFPAAINLLVNKTVQVTPLTAKIIAFDEFKDQMENPCEAFGKVIVKV